MVELIEDNSGQIIHLWYGRILFYFYLFNFLRNLRFGIWMYVAEIPSTICMASVFSFSFLPLDHGLFFLFFYFFNFPIFFPMLLFFPFQLYNKVWSLHVYIYIYQGFGPFIYFYFFLFRESNLGQWPTQCDMSWSPIIDISRSFHSTNACHSFHMGDAKRPTQFHVVLFYEIRGLIISINWPFQKKKTYNSYSTSMM
jgi:hypothetical protein